MSKYSLALIDDEPDLREIIRDILAPLDLQFFEASDGRSPLSLIQSGMADAVLSDMHMGEFDGRKLLKELRSQGNNIPIVILSGNADPSAVNEMLRLGCIDYLIKPMNEQKLIDAVKMAVEFGSIQKQFEKKLEESNVELVKTWENLTRLRNGFAAV